MNNANELNNITILQLRGDYFFHILMFLPWAFFHRTLVIKTFIWVFLGLAFAAGSEGLQYFLPYRAYNVNDLLANGLGVLVGFVVSTFFSIKKG